ncbi:MAG TPA: extensin family protein [Polyangiaceae bacterium]
MLELSLFRHIAVPCLVCLAACGSVSESSGTSSLRLDARTHVNPTLAATDPALADVSATHQTKDESLVRGSAAVGERGHSVAAAASASPRDTEPARGGEPAGNGWANLEPGDDELVGPPEIIEDCEQRLKAQGVTFRVVKLPLVKQRGFVCGAPQAIEYLEGPERIRFKPRPIVSCRLALGLAHFEHVLNATAREILGAKVTSIEQGGTYNCRSMARFRLVSEHSYANAIDLRSFGLSDARTVSVLRHFGRPSDAAQTVESQFLRTLGRRLFDENVFSVVVTRFFDELHRDHIHVDMAHYRTDGTR